MPCCGHVVHLKCWGKWDTEQPLGQREDKRRHVQCVAKYGVKRISAGLALERIVHNFSGRHRKKNDSSL